MERLTHARCLHFADTEQTQTKWMTSAEPNTQGLEQNVTLAKRNPPLVFDILKLRYTFHMDIGAAHLSALTSQGARHYQCVTFLGSPHILRSSSVVLVPWSTLLFQSMICGSRTMTEFSAVFWMK